MQITSLRPFFYWCEATILGQWVRGGTWEFPLIETIHILALTMLYGCTVVLSLRLMGVLMHSWTIARLAQQVTPYLNWSLVVILCSGILLYLSEATKTFDNDAFWVKVWLLFGALVFHFTVVRRVTKQDEVPRAIGFVVGLVSMVLWLGIGCAGRAIAFV